MTLEPEQVRTCEGRQIKVKHFFCRSAYFVLNCFKFQKKKGKK